MSEWQVRPGTVTDTSHDPRWVPFCVAVTVHDPIVGELYPLDGPLSWCAYQAALAAGARLPQMTTDWCPDFRLPLATWTRPGTPAHPKAASTDGGLWGWCCSRAHYTPVAHTTVQTRRMPSMEAMTRYSTTAKFHAGLGPTKARDTASEAKWPRVITWQALGDPDATRTLLTHLTHLGKIVRHGHGTVGHVSVTVGDDRAAWTDRDTHGRAPYWHSSRACAPAAEWYRD